MASDDAREQTIANQLRAIIFVMTVLGIVAMALAHGATKLFIVWFFIPGGWVAWRPRMGPIVLWIMWATTVAMFAVVYTADHLERLRTPEHAVMAGVLALLVIALPLVRRGVRQRSTLPSARVVK